MFQATEIRSEEEREATQLMAEIERRLGVPVTLIDRPDACDPAARNVMIFIKFGDSDWSNLKILRSLVDKLK